MSTLEFRILSSEIVLKLISESFDWIFSFSFSQRRRGHDALSHMPDIKLHQIESCIYL